MKEIDWSNLSFGYMRTDYNVRCYYRDGKWGELELCSEETLNIHMAATCLHYGQEAFEGLKAYRGKDGKIRIFRPEANAERLQSTCRGILMPELPTEKFCEEGSKGQRTLHSSIRKWCFSLHPSAADWYRRTSRCTSCQRIHVCDIRHSGRPVLQGWICH